MFKTGIYPLTSIGQLSNGNGLSLRIGLLDYIVQNNKIMVRNNNSIPVTMSTSVANVDSSNNITGYDTSLLILLPPQEQVILKNLLSDLTATPYSRVAYSFGDLVHNGTSDGTGSARVVTAFFRSMKNGKIITMTGAMGTAVYNSTTVSGTASVVITMKTDLGPIEFTATARTQDGSIVTSAGLSLKPKDGVSGSAQKGYYSIDFPPYVDMGEEVYDMSISINAVSTGAEFDAELMGNNRDLIFMTDEEYSCQ